MEDEIDRINRAAIEKRQRDLARREADERIVALEDMWGRLQKAEAENATLRAQLSDAQAERDRLRGRVRDILLAAIDVTTFAWSAMRADCDEARVECQRRLDNLRRALDAQGSTPSAAGRVLTCAEAIKVAYDNGAPDNQMIVLCREIAQAYGDLEKERRAGK